MPTQPNKAPEPKTPWNPSRKAAARVLNPLPAPTVCDKCGGEVIVSHHKEVYGRVYSDWPWMYRCPACDSSVGMHPFTSIPLGTLANRELRDLRKSCKYPFERIWQSGEMTRSEAYEALAKHLGISVESCHFGWFDQHQCRAARDWAIDRATGASRTDLASDPSKRG